MCGYLNSELSRFYLEMEAGYEENGGSFHRTCSKLLEYAATDNVAAFVYEVEERGADINGVSFWYGRSFGSKKMGFEERTPILIASLYGSLDVLKYIITSKKVDVNRARVSDGASALHCAAGGGSWSSLEAAKMLIDASADVNAVDVNGKKPGELIPPSVRSSNNSKRRTLEMLLNGVTDQVEEEESRTPPPAAKEGGGKKEYYPVDVSLPDINNGIYGTDEFRMYTFKVKPCSRAYSHDWTECPFVHPGENARRRDPRKFHYTCVPCPEFKKGSCAKADGCEYAHGVFESWLHPAQYRTRLCKDETGCNRKVCFFAHKAEDLRPLYASTGSAMPSPKSSPMDMTTPPMSPSVNCSSPMGWSSKVNLTPPTLQLPGSRLKSTLSARDVDLEMEMLGLEKIRTQHRQLEEMAGLSSPYGRMGDMKPTNLDDVFGSFDPSILSQLQALSPKIGSQLQSPTMRQNMNQLRASYPVSMSSSPSRKPSAYGFDSSAAVAAAVMNSRSADFSKRSQSFVDRSGPGAGYRSNISMQPKLSEWSSPDGRLEWGFSGEDANKMRKSASFGFRSGGERSTAAPASSNMDEPDVSWVNSLVKDGSHDVVPHWLEQMYIEQEQVVA